MHLTLECEQGADGCWLADVPELPGVLIYEHSANAAMAKAQVLALRVLAERREHGEAVPVTIHIAVPLAA